MGVENTKKTQNNDNGGNNEKKKTILSNIIEYCKNKSKHLKYCKDISRSFEYCKTNKLTCFALLTLLLILIILWFKIFNYGGIVYFLIYLFTVIVIGIIAVILQKTGKDNIVEIILFSVFWLLFTIVQLSQVDVQTKLTDTQTKLTETQTRIASGSAIVDLIDKLSNYKIKDYFITPIETWDLIILWNTINLHNKSYISFKLKYDSTSNIKFDLCDNEISKKTLLECKLVVDDKEKFSIVSCQRNNSDTLTYIIDMKEKLSGKVDLSLSLNCNLNYKNSLSEEWKQIVSNFLFVPIKKVRFTVYSQYLYQDKKFFLIDFSWKNRENNFEVKKVRQIIENNWWVLKTAPVLLRDKNNPFNKIYCWNKNNCFIILYKKPENYKVCSLLKYDIEKNIPVLSWKVFNINTARWKEFIEYVFTNVIINWFDWNRNRK